MPTRASGGKTELCGACFDCRRKGEQESRFPEKRVPGTCVVSGKKYTWLQYKKRQAPGTTFSTFSDEVRLEGEPGKGCRFATLTGVHQGARISLAKLWFKGKVPTGKIER